MIIEAPNWTLDGRWLILNGDGKLWRLAADGSSGLEQIELSGVPALNNDHVLAPDGRRVFVSANDWHIYEADLNGGPVRRVTNDHEMPFMHFLHGVSPDGETLAYVGLEPEEDNWWARANIFLIPAAGGPDRRLTDEWRRSTVASSAQTVSGSTAIPSCSPTPPATPRSPVSARTGLTCSN